jgi:hypothetical protein
MKKDIIVSRSHDELSKRDLQYWKSVSSEERLDQVELLRVEAGKFLYEYPARLRRVISVTRKK